tara:strand:+ start:8513 stop:8698 length:186 start_codon:yes stop_codon:yes gene_type:complete
MYEKNIPLIKNVCNFLESFLYQPIGSDPKGYLIKSNQRADFFQNDKKLRFDFLSFLGLGTK